MTRKGRIVIAAIVCALAASAIVVTQVGSGSSSNSDPKADASAGPQSGTPKGPPSSDPGSDGSKSDNPFAGPVPHIEPAKMLPPNSGFEPSSIMWPDNGGWRAGSHARATVVEAGGDARHKSDGLFSIIRENSLKATQTSHLVRVAGTGPVTVTKAPLGPKVVVWAQKRGNIQFTSKSGITGTLHLSDDTVTLNP